MTALAAQLSRPYPADWPVRRALQAYLDENGFSVDEYDQPVIRVTFWWLTFPFPNPPSRRRAVRVHDLHHIVTGYGTDPAGESEISAWELRRGVGVFSPFVRAIVFTGALSGLVHSPRRTWAAWKAGCSAAGVGLQPTSPDRYEQLLAMTVGELRAVYGVPRRGVTGARALHYAAPSRGSGVG